MVKFWNGAKWLPVEIRADANIVILNKQFYPIDQDGFITLGQFKFRLFNMEFRGTPVGAYTRR